MVRAVMHGCNGRMGQVITGLIRADEGIELVAGIDTYTGIKNDYPVFECIDQCDVSIPATNSIPSSALIRG